MLKLQVVGNLGSDAEVIAENGHKFVKLSIAHTERRRNPDGSDRESTTWVSATINGDGGNLLQYLKKGTKVYAYGDVGLRVFHSEKERRMVPGLNLYIRDIELVGGQPDEVPRDLYDTDGVAYRVSKYYHCQGAKAGVLMSKSGAQFGVSAEGWVSALTEQAQQGAQLSPDENSDEDAAHQEQEVEHTTKKNN